MSTKDLAKSVDDEITPHSAAPSDNGAATHPGPRDAGRREAPTFDRKEAADRLLGQAERVLAEIRQLYSEATETAGEALVSAKASGAEVVDSGKERARSARGDVEAYVAREPLKAILIAAGVGAVFGMWSRR